MFLRFTLHGSFSKVIWVGSRSRYERAPSWAADTSPGSREPGQSLDPAARTLLLFVKDLCTICDDGLGRRAGQWLVRLAGFNAWRFNSCLIFMRSIEVPSTVHGFPGTYPKSPAISSVYIQSLGSPRHEVSVRLPRSLALELLHACFATKNAVFLQGSRYARLCIEKDHPLSFFVGAWGAFAPR